jgi:hypothetical protein
MRSMTGDQIQPTSRFQDCLLADPDPAAMTYLPLPPPGPTSSRARACSDVGRQNANTVVCNEAWRCAFPLDPPSKKLA